MDITERLRWRSSVNAVEQSIAQYKVFGLDAIGRPVLVGQLIDDDKLSADRSNAEYQAYVERERALLEYCWNRIRQKGDDVTLRELKLFVRWVRLAKEQALDLQDFERRNTVSVFERNALSMAPPNFNPWVE